MAKGQIMLVDDDVIVLRTLRVLLEDEGFDVLTADSGQQALRVLSRATPNLIILDLRMPGMSGISFLNEISDATGNIKYPVLVLTAHAEMSGFFSNLDVDGFMLKPCTNRELISEITRILANHGVDIKTSEPTAAKPASAPTPMPTPMPSEEKRTVLLGEDDPDITDSLIRSFSQFGYGVDVAHDGSEVIGKAIMSRPDVVVLKQVLSGMNGDVVSSMLRDILRTKELPIVLYDDSGYADTLGESALRRRGVRKYVKGTDSASLLAAVKNVFQS